MRCSGWAKVGYRDQSLSECAENDILFALVYIPHRCCWLLRVCESNGECGLYGYKASRLRELICLCFMTITCIISVNCTKSSN
ncbi:hypothetical protein OF83DRAFT_1138494 [Amylostereum chailletii]|nr:hypothetical protein OF83DRAFT_1138494 [Amylostereum chailletii]